MLRHTLRQFGVEDERVRLQWASAAEGAQLAEAIREMVEQIRQLGPLQWPTYWSENGRRQEALKSIEREHQEAMEVPA
jgi:F420-non-reducing hydrogenase iron-sulfur subunit